MMLQCEHSTSGRLARISEAEQCGFTMIEVLVVMAIVAILTTVAIPIYTSYINKSKTANGQEAISNVMLTLEQSYQDNRTYPVNQAISDGQNYFNYNYTQSGNPTGQAYYITATGNGVLASDYIAANNSDVRCVCLECASNLLSSFTDTTTSCPTGTTSW